MLYLLKGRVQRNVEWLVDTGLSANQASFFGWVFVLAYAGALFEGLRAHPLLLLSLPILALGRIVMNALDGLIARKRGTATVGGEILNESSDIWGDMLSYGVLAFIPDPPRTSLMFFLIFCWAVEFYGVIGKGLPGGIRIHDAWGGGKSERLVLVSLFAVAIYFQPPWAEAWPIFLSCICGLLFLTCIVRVRKALRNAAGLQYKSITTVGR